MAARGAASELEADLAEVTVGFLEAEGFAQIRQREAAINDRTNAGGIHARHHLLLLRAAADDQTLQADLASHHGGGRYLTGEAGEDPDQ